VKRLFCVAAWLVLTVAARAENPTVRVHEETTIEIDGATAVYAIDPNIADVVLLRTGVVQITGRSAGTTQLIAVTSTATHSFLIMVRQSGTIAASPRNANGGTLAHEEARYVSSPRQFQNTFDVFLHDDERRSQFHLVNTHYFGQTFGRVSNPIPSAFYRVTTPRREITLLDDFVDVSPLTVMNTQVRGLHWREGLAAGRAPAFEFHAGYAASSLYEDVFLPSDRRWIAGAGYTFTRRGVAWTPSVYGFFSEPRSTSARRGAVLSLMGAWGNGETFDARAELAASRGIGGSADFRYETNRDRAHGRAVFKPDDFPTLGLADLRGTHVSADWTRRATGRLTLDTFGTFDRFRIGTARQSSGSLNLDGRYALSRYVALTGGVDTTDIRVSNSAGIRTISVPLGVLFDTAKFSAAATYRTIENSAASRRGDALRLSFRAGGQMFQMSAWGERQRQAPTLSLIFRDEPGLELTLLRLGISVRTPEDIARVLRDNAVLVNLGFIDGVTVNLAPKRVQSGVDLAFISPFDRRDQLRLHAIYDREEGIRTVRDAAIATLTFSHRIAATSEVYGSYTRWRTRALPLDDSGSSVEAGVRTNIEGLPQLLRRRIAITGFVFVDPEMRGTLDGNAIPLPAATVMLDGKQTVQTDGSGAYKFSGLEPGPHRVSVQLPKGRPAFFTTPSHREVDGNTRVDFGLVWTPARLSGRVVSDVNLGVPGVVVSIGPRLRATTDMNGAFSADTPPGPYRVELSPESLPPGYTITGSGERDVQLAADQPQQIAFEARALRSVGGTAAPGNDVTIAPLGRHTTADASGNYLFRSLPSGTFTITASGRSSSVTLPAEPTSLHDVDLGAAPVVAATAKPAAPSRRAEVPAADAYRVQVGAYRVAENADAARRELERLGLPPLIERNGALQIVSAGPFATREEAERAAMRLTDAGVENYLFGEAAGAVPLRDAPGYVVQVGAFREPVNARHLTSQLQRLGQQSFTVPSGGLTLVRTGPFRSRHAASAASERLRKAGFDALVLPR
jgi:cell division protein FtsN